MHMPCTARDEREPRAERCRAVQDRTGQAKQGKARQGRVGKCSSSSSSSSWVSARGGGGGVLTEQNATGGFSVACAGGFFAPTSRAAVSAARFLKQADQMGCKGNRNFALQIARLHGG